MATPPKNPVAEGLVVGVYYSLKDDQGTVLDTNKSGKPPLAFLVGAGNIIPGLERALLGKSKGDYIEVTVEPEEAYGLPKEELVQSIPRASLPAELEPEVGTLLRGQTPEGQTIAARITEVGEETVVIDQNHPLAGRTLHFEVTITGVREATEEEKAHGHPHGAGGHNH